MYDIKCSKCGRFIPIKDLSSGEATYKMITPDTEFSRETFKGECKPCKEQS